MSIFEHISDEEKRDQLTKLIQELIEKYNNNQVTELDIACDIMEWVEKI